MQKKLNTLTLSGLMIGPILGSEIVLLPPLAISILGGQVPCVLFNELTAVLSDKIMCDILSTNEIVMHKSKE